MVSRARIRYVMFYLHRNYTKPLITTVHVCINVPLNVTLRKSTWQKSNSAWYGKVRFEIQRMFFSSENVYF